MRKDVKLGLAVGGVLLAVLVVYVLVVPGNNANQIGARLDPAEESEASATNGGAQAAGATASQDQQANSGNASGGATADAGARNSGAGSAGAGGAGGADSAGGDNTGASADNRASGETAGGGWNWDALVNGTEKLPSLGAGTDVKTSDAIALANGGSVSSGATVSANDPSKVNTSPTNGTANGTTGGTAGGATGNGTTGRDAGTLADAPRTASSQSPPRQNAAGAQPTSIAPEPGTASTRTHIVKVGETYSSISAAAYGSSKFFAQIEQANPGVDPTRLKPGMTITLPAIDTKPAIAPGVAVAQQQQLDPRTQYKVQPNESLYTISIRLYGTADRMEKLYELNKTTIGDDMSRVKVGMVLKLPEPPTQSTAAATAAR